MNTGANHPGLLHHRRPGICLTRTAKKLEHSFAAGITCRFPPIPSLHEECLSRLILFGEASLRHVLAQYVEHFHAERNHQGKGNVLLFRRLAKTQSVKVRFNVANDLEAS